jgi:transcriptional regulator with XRE-family HTH domain
MSDGDFLIDPFEDEKPLTALELRQLRVLAGFSRSALERSAGLSAGRVRAVENGYLRLHCLESAKLRRLLFEEMANRASEIAKHLGAGRTEQIRTEQETTSP